MTSWTCDKLKKTTRVIDWTYTRHIPLRFCKRDYTKQLKISLVEWHPETKNKSLVDE